VLGVALNPADGVASYHILGERAHVPTVYTMAHLPSAELAARRQAAFQDILREWQPMQGSDLYAIQCPCRPDCGCIPLNEVPRIVLSSCMYVGELDYFFVEQPFLALYGFRIRWHCDECESEMACKFPMNP
ncbi:unnamed protein product, partial [Meganyctiphanes norvegica]